MLLASAALAAVFSLAGCEGDDGAPGRDGVDGIDGIDGVDGADGAGLDPITAAKPEACATCHGGVGGEHQAVYEKYTDDSTLAMTFTDLASVDNGNGTFTVTLEFSVTKNGVPYEDTAKLPTMEQVRFEAVQYFFATREYLNECRLNENYTVVAPGVYSVQDTNCTYAPEQQVNAGEGAHVYGYLAQTPLFSHEGGSGAEIPEGSHVHLYDDVASAALAYGTADRTSADAYVSDANVAGCEKCHGQPYLKHGYRAAQVQGLPDFAACKVCHYDNRKGGHADWQYMVDDPLAWATGAAPTADYSYTANIMNDVHMSHAMEFPYPMSMSNCASCHEGKLANILDNTNFTPETCKSCHPRTGKDAWPAGTAPEGKYYQANRAPAFEFLWTEKGVMQFHAPTVTNCQACHGAGAAPAFDAYHNGYDERIADSTGQRYAEVYTASIDDVAVAGNIITIKYSVSDPAMVPEVLVSFYGWDSKHFIVPSHTRDANRNRFEYEPGDVNPLFPSFDEPTPGNFVLTVDMAAWVGGKPGAIPDLITAGTIKKAEITVTPSLILDGIEVGLDAATHTINISDGSPVADYFKGPNATVDTEKCFVCHDQLAVTFHEGSGRGGDIVACKNCHVPTEPGSHLEMASRSLENYVHAIHSFQAFDPADDFKTFDPVLAKRYSLHIDHVFPNFTIRNCEACHVDAGAKIDPACTSNCETFPVTYNVPDQSKSIPGVLSKSDDPATWYFIDEVDGSPTEGLALEYPDGRNISGSIKEQVTGPASRACGGCHRARLINNDAAGDLASLNAHTEMGGTYVENDAEDTVLFGIIDKIMSMFE